MEVVDPSKVQGALAGSGLTTDGGAGGGDEQKMQILAMLEHVTASVSKPLPPVSE